MIHNTPLEVNMFVLLMSVLYLAQLANYRHLQPEGIKDYWYTYFLDLTLAGVATISAGILLNIMEFLRNQKKAIIHFACLLIILGILLMTIGIGFEIYGFQQYNQDVVLWLVISTAGFLVVFESVY